MCCKARLLLFLPASLLAHLFCSPAQVSLLLPDSFASSTPSLFAVCWCFFGPASDAPPTPPPLPFLFSPSLLPPYFPRPCPALSWRGLGSGNRQVTFEEAVRAVGTSNSKTMSSQMELLVLAYSHVTQSSAPLPLPPSAPPPSPPSSPPPLPPPAPLLSTPLPCSLRFSPLLLPPPLPTCNKPALPCRCCLSFLFFCLRVLFLTGHCVVQDSAPALFSCLFARPPFLFRLLGSGLLMQSRSFPCPLALSSRGGRRSVKLILQEKVPSCYAGTRKSSEEILCPPCDV